MNDRAKILLTIFIWLTTLTTFFATMALSVRELGGGIIPIAAFIFGAAIMLSGFIWQWGQKSNYPLVQEDSEKRKRERLDSVLRDMSDEDLIRLKERLVDGTVNDEVLYERMVGEDGELQYKRINR